MGKDVNMDRPTDLLQNNWTGHLIEAQHLRTYIPYVHELASKFVDFDKIYR